MAFGNTLYAECKKFLEENKISYEFYEVYVCVHPEHMVSLRRYGGRLITDGTSVVYEEAGRFSNSGVISKNHVHSRYDNEIHSWLAKPKLIIVYKAKAPDARASPPANALDAKAPDAKASDRYVKIENSDKV